MSVYKSQQRPHIKRCIAVQRQIYSEGKRYNTIQILLLFLVVAFVGYATFFNTGFMHFTKEDVRAAATAVNVMCVVGIQIISEKCREKQEKAASLQQYIDASLFSEAIGNEIEMWRYVKDRTEIDEILSQYPNYDGSTIKAWYEDYSMDIPIVQVLKCQMENISWDDYLRGYYLCLTNLIISVICLSMLLGWYFSGWNIIVFWMMLSCAAPLVKYYWFGVKHRIEKDHANLAKMKGFANHLLQEILEHKLKDEECIMKLINFQQQIYDSRKSCFLIPDWFHFRLFDRIHEKIQYREQCSKER